MNNSILRWFVIIAGVLLVAAVGFWAYQAGVAHGVAQSGKIVAPPSGPYPYPYPYYGWHRPWGFGFFFVPILFFIFFGVFARALFWRRAWYGGGYGPCGPRGRFEEWHRQAHAREGEAPAAGAAGER